MQPKSYLLPHNFQKIGWALFIISFGLGIAFRYGFDTLKLFNQNNHYLPGWIMYIFVMLSMIFVAFSKEKIEDELIHNVRFSSIVVTVLIGILSHILTSTILAFNRDAIFVLMIINPITLFILYISIFRTRLFMFKRGLKNAE